MSLVVTIFSAVHLEARAIARAIEAPVPTAVLPVHSTFEGLKIVHHLIGLRAVGLKSIRLDSDASCAILAGVAGALDPRLAIGDLVLCDCPEELSTRLEIPRRLIVTSDRVVATAAEKAELFATSSAGVVDMETTIVRKFAADRGLPFIALRSVSDTATHSLDPRVLGLIDQWGRARPGEVWSFISGNPFRLLSLLKLGRNSNRAARRLGEGVVTVLRAIGGS